jgi:isorenieratene synthase
MKDPRRVSHPPASGLPHASALPAVPHVVVIGAGIAGLAAAAGLAERGVSVEVLEREPNLGGRVAGWTDHLDSGPLAGTEVANNRGFHAFFRQYYNLRELLRRSDPNLDRLRAVEDYPLIDGQGRRDTFRGLPQSPPWNALVFAMRSPTFRFRDLVRIKAKAAAPLAAVTVPGIYDRLDDLDAETFLEDAGALERLLLALFVVEVGLILDDADLHLAVGQRGEGKHREEPEGQETEIPRRDAHSYLVGVGVNNLPDRPGEATP